RSLSLEFAADEFLDAIACDIVGNLARRMFHRIGRDRVERAADLAVARELEASNRVDHDTARVRRVLHGHPQLELDRNAREALALNAQKADLVVVLPRHVIRRTDMDVD